MRLGNVHSYALLLALCANALCGCGNAGESNQMATSYTGPTSDLAGTITSDAGSQSEMAGWVLAMMEADTAICRVAEADQGGIFILRHADVQRSQTLVLLSPDYIFSGVMSLPPVREKTVRQYFMPKAQILPRLVQKGPIMVFDPSSLGLISITGKSVHDDVGDGTPNGMRNPKKGFGLDGGVGFNLSTPDPNHVKVDSDGDGTYNYLDPDIDGDGIPNVFDDDMDGDGILNVFDRDANGDMVDDGMQTVGQPYFPEGVEFIAAQYEQTPQDDGSTKGTLTFTAKVRDGVSPIAVRVRGAASVLNNALVEYTDAKGNPGTVAFAPDYRLMDDGKSNDGTAGDRIYARRVTLASGISPRPHQVFFVQLAFGAVSNPYFWEYPFTFPNLSISPVNGAYDSNSRQVQLKGSPFGGVLDFLWSVDVFDSNGTRVYASKLLPGTQSYFVVPSNVLRAGASYAATVTAQSLDKVPGYPTYIIHSPKIKMQ